MVIVDGETVVDPRCSSPHHLRLRNADGFATSSRMFERKCGDRKLSYYASKHLDGSEATVSIVGAGVDGDGARYDYTDDIRAWFTPSHDIHGALAECFEGGTQIGFHVPSGDGGDGLNLVLSQGRVMDDHDRRARGEWLDQQPGARRDIKETFRMKCDGDGSPESLRKCVEALKASEN